MISPNKLQLLSKQHGGITELGLT